MNKYFHMIPLWQSPTKLPVELPVEQLGELRTQCWQMQSGNLIRLMLNHLKTPWEKLTFSGFVDSCLDCWSYC